MGEKLDVMLGRIYILIWEEKNKNKNKVFKKLHNQVFFNQGLRMI